jgi:hypothetical protein
MQLFLMREDPDNSGHYVDVDIAPFDNLHQAHHEVVKAAAEPGRYALRFYESLRTDKAHQDDKDATQAASAQTGAAGEADAGTADGAAGAATEVEQPAA